DADEPVPRCDALGGPPLVPVEAQRREPLAAARAADRLAQPELVVELDRLAAPAAPSRRVPPRDPRRHSPDESSYRFHAAIVSEQPGPVGDDSATSGERSGYIRRACGQDLGTPRRPAPLLWRRRLFSPRGATPPSPACPFGRA